MVVKLIKSWVSWQSTYALCNTRETDKKPLSVVLEKTHCQRFLKKYHTPASRKTPQSLAVEASFSCLGLLAMFSLQQMPCV